MAFYHLCQDLVIEAHNTKVKTEINGEMQGRVIILDIEFFGLIDSSMSYLIEKNIIWVESQIFF